MSFFRPPPPSTIQQFRDQNTFCLLVPDIAEFLQLVLADRGPELQKFFPKPGAKYYFKTSFTFLFLDFLRRLMTFSSPHPPLPLHRFRDQPPVASWSPTFSPTWSPKFFKFGNRKFFFQIFLTLFFVSLRRLMAFFWLAPTLNSLPVQRSKGLWSLDPQRSRILQVRSPDRGLELQTFSKVGHQNFFSKKNFAFFWIPRGD